MPVARFARYYRANWVPGIPTIGRIPYGHPLQYTTNWTSILVYILRGLIRQKQTQSKENEPQYNSIILHKIHTNWNCWADEL